MPWFAVASALLGAFQFGYNTGVMNAPKRQMQESFGVADNAVWDWQYTVIVSMFCVGGFFGALAGGPLASRLGRRPAILFTGVVFIVAGVLEASAGGYRAMSLGRVLVGIGSGVATTVVPAYLVEVSPAERRGGMGTLVQFTVTVAILVSTLFGFAINKSNWWMLFAFPACLGAVQVLSYPVLVETKEGSGGSGGGSSRGLGSSGRQKGSGDEEALLGNATDDDSSKGAIASVLRLLSTAIDREALFISMGMMACQQLSGINCVIYYSTSIFSSAGMHSPLLAACLVNGVNVIMTQISASAVDRAGRRVLMMAGCGGMLLSALLLTLVFNMTALAGGGLTVVFTMSFVAFFAIGPGSIPWFYVSELFDADMRPTAASIAGGFNWICNFIVGISFLPMQSVLGRIFFGDASEGNRVVFVPFIAVLCVCLVFLLHVPETKNRSVEQIREAMQSRRRRRGSRD